MITGARAWPLLRWAAVVSLAVAVLGGVACGRRGPPLPPVLVVPEAPELLPLEQDGGEVTIRWVAPRIAEDGSGEDLRLRRAVLLYRVVEIQRLAGELRASQRGSAPMTAEVAEPVVEEAMPAEGVADAAPETTGEGEEVLEGDTAVGGEGEPEADDEQAGGTGEEAPLDDAPGEASDEPTSESGEVPEPGEEAARATEEEPAASTNEAPETGAEAADTPVATDDEQAAGAGGEAPPDDEPGEASDEATGAGEEVLEGDTARGGEGESAVGVADAAGADDEQAGAAGEEARPNDEPGEGGDEPTGAGGEALEPGEEAARATEEEQAAPTDDVSEPGTETAMTEAADEPTEEAPDTGTEGAETPATDDEQQPGEEPAGPTDELETPSDELGEPTEGAVEPPPEPEPPGTLLDIEETEFEVLSEVDSEIAGEERSLAIPVEPEWIGGRLEVMVRYESRGGDSEDTEPQALDITHPLPSVAAPNIGVSEQGLNLTWPDERPGAMELAALASPTFEVVRRRGGESDPMGRTASPSLMDGNHVWGEEVCYQVRLVVAGSEQELVLDDPGPEFDPELPDESAEDADPDAPRDEEPTETAGEPASDEPDASEGDSEPTAQGPGDAQPREESEAPTDDTEPTAQESADATPGESAPDGVAEGEPSGADDPPPDQEPTEEPTEPTGGEPDESQGDTEPTAQEPVDAPPDVAVRGETVEGQPSEGTGDPPPDDEPIDDADEPADDEADESEGEAGAVVQEGADATPAGVLPEDEAIEEDADGEPTEDVASGEDTGDELGDDGDGEPEWTPVLVRVPPAGTGGIHRGPLSPEVCITPVDTFAPPPPTDLRAFWRPAHTELSWREPASGDPVGYHVYRSTPGEAGFDRLTETPIAAITFRDEARDPDAVHDYRVSAVDGAEAPNEGLRSEPVRAGPRR